MDKQQEQLIQAFMLDLGIVLGAKNEQEALLTGQAAVLKLGENAGKLFLAWGQAESLQQGAGRQVIAEALGGNKNTQALLPATIGSMQPTYNAAPTPTSYGDPVSYAKLGTKIKNVSRLNGHCPEGYEVEKYLAGGCVKCKKKKQLALTEELKHTNKKRIKKHAEGDVLTVENTTSKPNINFDNILNTARQILLQRVNSKITLQSLLLPVGQSNAAIKDVLQNDDSANNLNMLNASRLEAKRKADTILRLNLLLDNQRMINTRDQMLNWLPQSVPMNKCGGKQRIKKHECGKKLGKLKNADKVTIKGNQGMFDYGKI